MIVQKMKEKQISQMPLVSPRLPWTCVQNSPSYNEKTINFQQRKVLSSVENKCVFEYRKRNTIDSCRQHGSLQPNVEAQLHHHYQKSNSMLGSDLLKEALRLRISLEESLRWRHLRQK